MVENTEGLMDLIIAATGVGALVATVGSNRRVASIPIRSRRLTALGGAIFWMTFIARQLLIESGTPMPYRLLIWAGAAAGLIAVCLLLVPSKAASSYPAREMAWRTAAMIIGFPAIGAALYCWANGLSHSTLSQAATILGLCLMAGAVIWSTMLSKRHPMDSDSSSSGS